MNAVCQAGRLFGVERVQLTACFLDYDPVLRSMMIGKANNEL